MELISNPVDTGRKLNVHNNVFWTSYVRSIYVVCLLEKQVYWG